MFASRVSGAAVIVCSIDLINGKAVQLQQGQRLVLERDDVVAIAERFGRLGEVAVIDLDAAMNRGSNRELIEALCRIAPCRVGGGIRDAETARRYMRAGARRVILGTAATPELLRLLPRDRTIVAIDARGNRVATHGWRVLQNESPEERAARLAPYCSGFLFTDVEREGMLGGIDIDRMRALRGAIDGTLTVAGGIRSVAEIRALDALGIDAQVGMAVYTSVLDPIEAFVALVDFEKGDGLVPTVVCDDEDGSVRMTAYSSADSLRVALREGIGAYWSRSRRELWRKGETSGNRQRLRRVQIDCDRDALIFRVEQAGPTCHSGEARCFSQTTFSWNDLLGRIAQRARSGGTDSYTNALLADAKFLEVKLLEEAQEVADARTRDEVAWECADLLYFMSVKMQASGVGIDDVMYQLAARAR